MRLAIRLCAMVLVVSTAVHIPAKADSDGPFSPDEGLIELARRTQWNVYNLSTDRNRADYNRFQKGQCTWFVRAVRDDRPFPVPSGEGDAWEWYDHYKRAGYGVGQTPRPGAIACFGVTASNEYGHVAFVSAVRGNVIEIWDSNFRKDLKVRRHEVTSATQLHGNFQGYVYLPRSSVLTLDVSGSMSDRMPDGTPKIDALQEAVRGYLKAVDDEIRRDATPHRIGVVAFSEHAHRICDFTSDTGRVAQATASLTPQSATNFGDALGMAIGMLERAGGDPKTLVFMSDGKTNTGPLSRDAFLVDYDPTASPSSMVFRDSDARELYRRAREANVRIITIGFGDPGQSSSIHRVVAPWAEADVDDQVLRRIADAPGTGGRYFNATKYTEFLMSFAAAQTVGAGRQLVYETTGSLARGESSQHTFNPATLLQHASVERRHQVRFLIGTPAHADGMAELLVTLGWDSGRVSLTLTDPAGIEVTPEYPGARISADAAPVNVFIDDPKRGEWSATLVAEEAPSGSLEYYLLASARIPAVLGVGGVGPSGDDQLLLALLFAIAFLGLMCAIVAVRRRGAPVRRSAGRSAGQPRAGRVYLQIQPRGGAARNIALSEAVLYIGRAPGNQLVLADPKVSSRHALLRWQGGQVTLTDLGSTNGTWVNDRRVGEAALRVGDRVRVGDTELVLRST